MTPLRVGAPVASSRRHAVEELAKALAPAFVCDWLVESKTRAARWKS